MILESINNFLFEKEVAVIHLIVVSILSPLIIWLFRRVIIAIWEAIKKAVKTVYEFIASINRFRRRQITLRDYKNIVARLESGGKLRWYEKEAYYEAKKQREVILREAAKSLSLDFRGIAESLNLKMPLIPQIKEFPNRQDGEGGGRGD